MVWWYYRSRAVLLHLLPLQVSLNPTRDAPPRVEAVVARYCSGTAAEDPQAVLPLGTAVLPLGPKTTHPAGNQTSNDAGRPRGCEREVYVMIPPKPFQHGPPLNSTTFLRLKSTEKKRRQTPSSIVFAGDKNRLVPSDETSKILKAHN